MKAITVEPKKPGQSGSRTFRSPIYVRAQFWLKP